MEGYGGSEEAQFQEKQAEFQITPEMLDIERIHEFLRHADPNSEEYLFLINLLEQERAKGEKDVQMTEAE